jgi:hypothetical protein
VIAIRRHARLTGEYDRAITELDTLAGVGWHDENRPSVPQRPGLRSSSLGLADMLRAAGQKERAQALLDSLVAQMTAEMRAPGRSETWYCYGMAVAMALQDQPEHAIGWLRRGVELGALDHDETLVLQGDPAFDALRTKPEFIAVLRSVRAHADREAAELAQLRAQGKVPARR